jgi:cell division protein ZapA (FtsZ GTPase activity inhibitor)
MNVIVKQYLASLKEDVSELDLFCDDELTSVVTLFILKEKIQLLEELNDLYQSNNFFIEERLDFLKDVLSELKTQNEINGYNTLEYLK